MKKLNITKGEWKVVDNGCYLEIKLKGNNVTGIASCIYTGVDTHVLSKLNNKDNAKLIADAGTTYNKCNLTPSELLERYNEAIEVLEESKKQIEHLHECCQLRPEWEEHGTTEDTLHIINRAIQKSTQ